MGYPYGKKGWKLHDLKTNKFFVSRVVVFQEDEFPFSTVTPEKTPVPAVVESFDDVVVTKGVASMKDTGSTDVAAVEDRGVVT